jgi:prepilin-type processing-associated H-X9-DG protein
MQPTNFTCNRCGAPLTPGTTQCANCGQTFAAPVPYGAAPGFMPPSPPQKNSAGLIIGLTVGLVGLFFFVVILAAILFPVFARARDKAREISSRSNMKQLGLATLEYCQDYDAKFPPMDTYDHYKTAILPYLRQPSGSPDLFTETGANVPYAINSTLSRKDSSSLSDPGSTVVLKETVPHADHMINVLYADGHVEVTFPDGTPGNTDTDTSN